MGGARSAVDRALVTEQRQAAALRELITSDESAAVRWLAESGVPSSAPVRLMVVREPDGMWYRRISAVWLAADVDSQLVGVVSSDTTVPELDLVADRSVGDHLVTTIVDRLEGDMTLLTTPKAWLDHDARPKATANALGVHPNTVVYRLGRIRERLGSIVDDRRRRWSLHLGLHLATTELPDSSSAVEDWSPTGVVSA